MRNVTATDPATGITYTPIHPAIAWATAHDHVMSVLSDHGLSGTVYDASSPHPCDVRLTIPGRYRYADQVSTLLRSALDASRYSVTPPECGTVTVMIRTGTGDIMGSSGLVHREDSSRMTPVEQAHLVARRRESVA